MRQALKGRRGPRGVEAPVSSVMPLTWGACVEGWDTETPAEQLPTTRAIACDNWLPHGIQLELRKGFDNWADGADGLNSGMIESLMPYNAAGGSSKLFAAGGGNIYDVTSANMASVSHAGASSDFWSCVNFTNAGVAVLWCCNDSGADVPIYFNGTVWTATALTGITPADVFYVWESHSRLFVLLQDSLTFGYLAVNAISGAVTTFPLGAVFKRGGRLVAGFRISRDSGAGMQDWTGFLTSEGEVVVYQGNDPGTADTWSRLGTWFIGEPIGARPIVDLGADVGVLTRNGLVSLMQVMAGGSDIDPASFPYLTARISSAVRTRANIDPANTMWQGLAYPAGNLVVLNAPLSGSQTAQQFVRHRITGGWYRFTGWNFNCFAVFNGKLYAAGRDDTIAGALGNAGRVVLCDSGYNDGGDDIVGLLQWPWNDCGARGVVKQAVLARPIVTTTTGAAVQIVARADYADTPALPEFTTQPLTDALIWGVGLWGVDRWGGRTVGAKQWRTISATGHAISILLGAKSNKSRFALNGLDLLVNGGGPV